MKIHLAKLLTVCALGCGALRADPAPFVTGVDSNYPQQMAAEGREWKTDGRPADLFTTLHAAGAGHFRTRVWTVVDGPGSTPAAVTLAKKAQDAGMKPYLVLFLSENWADYVKQPAPPAWAALTLEEKLTKISGYTEQTARAFKDADVSADLYEIGNEIDFGICGEYEERWSHRFNMEHMKANVWPGAARVIRAAEEGVRKVDPQARFILHLTQWWNPDFCIAFHQAMAAGGATVDYIGLSYFPSSGLSPQQTFADLGASVDRISKETGVPVIICETGYPCQPQFGGQFAKWNVPVPGYPLTEDGQRRWLADALSYCRGHDRIKGFFYWSPEWYPDMWTAFALFGPDGHARPSLHSLR